MSRRSDAVRFVAFGLSALVLGGCAARPKPVPESAVPTADQVERIRGSYQTAFPKARVGVVTAVLPAEPYALIGQVDVTAIHPGDVFTFLDADESVIANGTVLRVEPTGLTVRFEPARRAPQVGDAAVKF